MITVAAFSKPEEAHLLRLRLAAGGVQAFIQDENLIQIDWLMSNALGGVKVLIDEADAELAKQILSSDAEGLDELPDDSEPDRSTNTPPPAAP